MARTNVTFGDLIEIARRTGVENWVDPDTGRRGAVIAAPSSHRGQVGKMGTVTGVTRHHTGTSEDFKPTEDYPTYQVVKEGRPGLDNSLSAFGLGRWFGIYVFSEDLSWHAGVWNWHGITDGNGHFWGTEAEGTGARWTPFQREFYPRLTASELLFIGEGLGMMPRHADGAMPLGRKDDAKNLWPTFDAEVQNYLDHPELLTYKGTSPSAPVEDDDMKPLLYRLVNTPTVYLATPGRFVGIDPNFLGTLQVMGLLTADYKLTDLPTQAHLDFTRNYFENFLAPYAAATDSALSKLDELLAEIANTPTA